MTKIGESIPDEILAKIHISGARMDAMAWAARNHPLYAAIRNVAIGWPERAQLEAFIVGLLCENIRLKDQIVDIYKNLKPADVLIPETYACGKNGLMKTQTAKDHPGSGIPHNAICYFMNGNQVCAVFGDFINLQESPAGFGDDMELALADLKVNHEKAKVGLKS